MSKGSSRAHAKLARKMRGNRKVRKAARASTRAAGQPRTGVAALALTSEDLENMRWALGAVLDLETIRVDCPEVTAICPEPKCSGPAFVAKPQTEHVVRLDDLRDVAGVLEHLLSKVGEGATLHFAPRS